MNCPVCKRDLAPTLSICLTCGAMMNDTVREELRTKIAAAGDSGKLSHTPRSPLTFSAPEPVIKTPPIVKESVRKPATPKPATADLSVKKTSPTLVGFQSRNPTMPDWRLQLQNSIRQRSAATPQATAVAADIAETAKKQITNDANALKTEAKPEPAHPNPRVANALRRIEDSRKTFLESGAARVPAGTAQPSAPRGYPFNVVSRVPLPNAPLPPAAANAANAAKPRLVSSLRIEKRGLDTNKLPPLHELAPNAEPIKIELAEALPEKIIVDERPKQEPLPAVAVSPTEPTADDFEPDELDDLAPFSMRFGAGLFDLIIGAFATAILLSPLMLSGGSWMSVSGILAFAAALAIILFTYLTLTVGLTGRTFGMRLFSLEMIDVEENAYPTLHQAAVSASVYLLSIALGGIGFLPLLFNDEKRAAHDILSGTILIREI